MSAAPAGKIPTSCCKGGAEGCIAVCVPSVDVAVVAKTEDGNGRGTYAVVLEALRRLELVTSAELDNLAPVYRPEMRNCNGIRCGEIVGAIGEAPPESVLPRLG
jgi:L-asparaginase II